MLRPLATVSAPLPHCRAPLAPPRRYAQVRLLDGTALYFSVEPKTRVRELQEQVCLHLSTLGMMDSEIFGLAAIIDGDVVFVEPENKLSKWAPKGWKASHDHGLDSSGRPLLILYFRVQFYVESALLLRDAVSQHLYYLQLRQNVVTFEQMASRELFLFLAALALQADLGDFKAGTHAPGGGYFRPDEFLPRWVVDSSSGPSLGSTLATLHRSQAGTSRQHAELQYIKEASNAQAPHNLHLFRMRTKKSGYADAWLGVCAQGIHVYQDRPGQGRSLSTTFAWNHISKLYFERKKFEIRGSDSAENRRLCFFASSDSKAKHLLTLCKAAHQHALSMQPRLAELKKKQEEERRQNSGVWTTTTSPSDQRVSVISTASSNTTSGIVSDRVQGPDESEDDLETELEAMLHGTSCANDTSVAPPLPPPRVTTRPQNTPTTEDSCSSRCSTVRRESEGGHPSSCPNPHGKSRSEGDCKTPAALSSRQRAAAAVRSWLALVSAPRGRSRSDVADAWVCRHCGSSQSVANLATTETPKKVDSVNNWTSQASLPSDSNGSYYVRSLQRGGGQTLTSGTYPNRATVSATFDTDSDYVQVDDPGGAYVTLHRDFGLKEAPARFITTKPHISVLTAHASKAPKASPCFATPTKPLPPLPSSPVYGVMMDPGDIETPPKSRTCSFSSNPPQLAPVATVYASQVALGQIAQFRQQLYSDVDYVVFPLEDPAISRQAYLDSKQSALVAKGVVGKPPPPYRSPKMSSMYRSAPNVATPLPPASTLWENPVSPQLASSSLQNISIPWSGNGVNSAGVPPVSLSTGGNTVRRNNAVPAAKRSCAYMPRARSDESVLSGGGGGGMAVTGGHPLYKAASTLVQTSSSVQRSPSNGVALDIASLRAKSRDLDLPLISALCNDCSLLQQTSTPSSSLSPKAGGRAMSCSGSPSSGDPKGSSSCRGGGGREDGSKVIADKLRSKSVSAGSNPRALGRAAKQLFSKKYPVSGLSTVQIRQIGKNGTSVPSVHQHPHDRSPPRYAVLP